MTLEIKSDDNLFTLRYQNIDAKKQSIVCFCQEDKDILVNIDYPLLVADDFQPQNFKTIIFKHKCLNENDIVQIYDKKQDTRIGWCFPIQALCSIEHSFADNPHFLRYAYVSIFNILHNSQNLGQLHVNIFDSIKISLSDFFMENTAVCTFCLDTFAAPDQFCIDEWLPSLSSYGYIPNDVSLPVIHSGIKIEGNRLNLTRTSTYIQNRDFITNLFSKLIPCENNPVLLFFYLYQIVELLLEQVFEKEKEKFLPQLVSSIKTKDTVQTKEFLNKISDLSSEKKRLNLLFSNYIEGTLEKQILLSHCNALLQTLGKPEKTNLQESLYMVRNVLFHQYRNIPETSLTLLKEISLELSFILVQVTSQFVEK